MNSFLLDIAVLSDQDTIICRCGPSEYHYQVYQIQGQRYASLRDLEDSQRADHAEPRAEVFLCGLPRVLEMEDIFRFLAPCGLIYQARLLMDFSGHNRGRGFVRFFSAEASRRAICCLNRTPIVRGGMPVSVKMSYANDQLVLTSVPPSVTEDQMRTVLRQLLGDDFPSLLGFALRPSTQSPGRSSVCHCRFRDHQQAVRAHKKAWPYLFIAGKQVEVQWAVPELVRSATNLFFTNYPDDTTREEFFGVLMERVRPEYFLDFRLNMRGGAVKQGSITFVDEEAMRQAEVTMKGMSIRGAMVEFSRVPFDVLRHQQSQGQGCLVNNVGPVYPNNIRFVQPVYFNGVPNLYTVPLQAQYPQQQFQGPPVFYNPLQ